MKDVAATKQSTPPPVEYSPRFRIQSEYEPAGDQLTDLLNEQREFRKSSPRRRPGPMRSLLWIPASAGMTQA